MQLNPSLFGTRETTQKFHVFYDRDSGQTIHILRNPTTEQLQEDHIVVAIDDELVTAVMQGKLSINQLIVAFDKDSNTRSLFKKDQYLRRVHEENSTLLKIEKVVEADRTKQLTLGLYDSGLLEVEINKSSLDSFISIVTNSNETYRGYDHLNFYFVHAKDPLMLYDSIVIDTSDLVNTGRIKVDVPWYNKEVSKNVAVYTKRIFSTYQVVTRETYIETPDKNDNRSMQYLSDKTVDTDCHISVNIKGRCVEIQSTIVDPVKYDIFDELHLHVVKKNDPNQYIRTITVTADQLKNKGTVLLEKWLDNTMAVVHDNPNIKINVRNLNESTNDRV